MSDATVSILVALLSCIGTAAGAITGIIVSNRLSTFRIEQLEKKIDKYASNVDEIRERLAVVERDITTAFNKIDELKGDVREINKN